MAKFIEVRGRYGNRCLVNLDMMQGITEYGGKCILYVVDNNRLHFGDFTEVETDVAYDTIREMISSATGGIPMQPMGKQEKQT